jgi:hypothetical protein
MLCILNFYLDFNNISRKPFIGQTNTNPANIHQQSQTLAGLNLNETSLNNLLLLESQKPKLSNTQLDNSSNLATVNSSSNSNLKAKTAQINAPGFVNNSQNNNYLLGQSVGLNGVGGNNAFLVNNSVELLTANNPLLSASNLSNQLMMLNGGINQNFNVNKPFANIGQSTVAANILASILPSSNSTANTTHIQQHQLAQMQIKQHPTVSHPQQSQQQAFLNYTNDNLIGLNQFQMNALGQLHYQQQQQQQQQQQPHGFDNFKSVSIY